MARDPRQSSLMQELTRASGQVAANVTGTQSIARPILVAAVLIILGCGLAWLFGRSTTLTCTRMEPGQIDCTAQDRLLGLLPLGPEQRLERIRGAQIDMSCSDRVGAQTDACSAYLSVRTAQGGTPVGPALTIVSAKELSDQIDQFVAAAAPDSLSVSIRDVTMLVLGLLCGVVPSFILSGLFIWAAVGRARRRAALSAGVSA